MSPFRPQRHRASAPAAARRRAILALVVVACALQSWRLVHPEPLLGSRSVPVAPTAVAPGGGTGSQPAGGPSPAAGGQQPGPTLTVPPPPGVPIPEGAVLLYESPGAAPAGPAPRRLYPNDLLRGLVQLEKHGTLALSREQARQLLPVVKQLGDGYRDMRQVREELLKILTAEQMGWLEGRRSRATDLPAGAPEQTAEPLARQAREALQP